MRKRSKMLSPKEFIEDAIQKIKDQIGDEKAIIALSGGVDSSVCSVLVQEAIGDNLTAVFVDHGLLREGEVEQVTNTFKDRLNFKFVDASDEFMDQLAGVEDPEEKRKIIGHEFITCFVNEAKKLNGIKYLAQGTIYPDITESKGIKAHHNVGGLPSHLNFELVEPVRLLYNDEVRLIGKALGLPDELVYRQAFPGPGLAVRCPGSITKERLEIVRETDAILRDEFNKCGLSSKVWQYFTIVPDYKTVGVKDNKRTYLYFVVIRAVNSVDATSATVEEIPYDILFKIRDRMLNEVEGINRVLIDITPKPTGTIEWE
jgi:GMP synthase (glutamine-hydrolysing)